LLLDVGLVAVPLVPALPPRIAWPPRIAGPPCSSPSPSVRSIGMVGPGLDFPKIVATLCIFRLLGGGGTGFVFSSGGGGTEFVLVAYVGVLVVVLCVCSKLVK
jgi:hypothetical protein